MHTIDINESMASLLEDSIVRGKSNRVLVQDERIRRVKREGQRLKSLN